MNVFYFSFIHFQKGSCYEVSTEWSVCPFLPICLFLQMSQDLAYVAGVKGLKNWFSDKDKKRELRIPVLDPPGMLPRWLMPVIVSEARIVASAIISSLHFAA